MQKKNKEFDRTFFKTHKSRSIKFSPNKSAGFTLIELLVVISIIALLSTVVLAALQDSRVKARNTAKNSLVLEYVKALELYRSDHEGSYPITSDTHVCFGYATGEYCYANLYEGDSNINDDMSNYLPENFALLDPVMVNGANFNGVRYKCTGVTSCDTYELAWILEKNGQKCIYGRTSNTFVSASSCIYSNLNND